MNDNKKQPDAYTRSFSGTSPYEPTHHTSEAPSDTPLDLQHEFHAMLGRLCVLAGVPDADHPAVIEQQAFKLAEVPIAFQLEEWSGFVKIYVDVGEPEPAYALEMYRYLLEQQLYMPAPFQMVVGVHSESKRIVLYACAPLPTDAEGDEQFFALLQSCVIAVRFLKTDWAEKSLNLETP